jgi:hypothetical protein
VDPDHAALLADVDRWLDAARDLADVLSHSGEQVVAGRDLLARSMSIPQTIAATSTTPRYLRMNLAPAEFEAVRFSLRSSLINAALAEGLEGRQLVELLGVPSDRTARFVDELERQKRGDATAPTLPPADDELPVGPGGRSPGGSVGLWT